MVSFYINNNKVSLDVAADTPLLWIVREVLGLKGSKYGCGMGVCGACTMHLDGKAIRTCVLPVLAVQDKHVTTIEGLSETDKLHPLQQSWIDEKVPQCGYCQSGQLMTAASLLDAKPTPSDSEIEQAMQGNICRCGTYPRIRKAIKRAAAKSNVNPIEVKT